MSFKKKTLLNVYQFGRFTYTGEIINFAASIILARLLLPEEYGFVAMIYVITNFASIFTGPGMGSEIVRSQYGYTFQKSALSLAFGIGSIVTICIILLAYPIARFYDNNELIIPIIIVAFQFVIRGVTMVYYSIVLKAQKYTYLGQVELISNIFANTLMIAMAALKFSYWSLIIPFLLTDYIKLIAYRKQTSLPLKIHSYKYVKVAFKYSKSLIGNIMGARIISYWARNLDTILIGKTFGEAPLGLYNRGYRFLELSNKIFETLFGNILYPNLQKLKDENGDVIKEYFFFLGLISFLSFPIGLALIVFPRILVLILWGNDWIMVADYLPYFGLIVLINASFSNSETVYKIYYKEKLIFIIGAIAAALNVMAIITGMFYSALMVAKLLAFVHVIIMPPIMILYAFRYELKINFLFLMKFYFLRSVLLAAILYSSWINNYSLSFVLMMAYLLMTLYNLKDDILRLNKYVFSRFKK